MKKRIFAAFLAMAMVGSMTTGVMASEGDKTEINVIAAEYGQNTKEWWANFVDSFNNNSIALSWFPSL